MLKRLQFRSDTGAIQSFERLPHGGIRVRAAFTKPGVYDYETTDGKTSRELKPPAVFYSADMLSQLRDAPVTVDHPGSFVSPANWKRHAVGNVSGTPQKEDSTGLVVGDVVINDQRAIADIESGELKEISLGYFAQIVEESGTFDGKDYDRKQTAPTMNHVALGGNDWGRLGSEVSLRLNAKGELLGDDAPEEEVAAEVVAAGWLADSKPVPKKKTRRGNKAARRNQATPRRQKETRMHLIKIADSGAVTIDGVDHKLTADTTPTARQSLDRAVARVREDASDDTRAAVEDSVEAATLAFDLAVDTAGLRAELEKAKTDAKKVDVDQLVEDRAELIGKARALDPKIETKGRTNSQIMRDAVAKAGVEVPEDATDEYVRGRMDSLDAPKRDDQKVRDNANGLGGQPPTGSFGSKLAEAEKKRNDSIYNAANKARAAHAAAKEA